MNYYDETNKTFEPAWARDEVNKLTQSSNKRLDWVWTNTVTYSKAFGKNNLTALLGTEAKKNHSESMFGYGTGLAVEDEDYISFRAKRRYLPYYLSRSLDLDEF